MIKGFRKELIDLKLKIRMLISKINKKIMILEPNDFDDMESCTTLIGEAGMKFEYVFGFVRF